MICCVFCKTGKEFKSLTSLASHRRCCKKYRDFAGLGEVPDNFKSNPGNRGKGCVTVSQKMRESGSANITSYNKSRPESSRVNQSLTRKSRIASGEIQIPKGGYSKFSRVTLKNGSVVTLRSSYELLYAIWLYHTGRSFEYETVRVEHEGHTRTSDFLLEDGRLVEVGISKGTHSWKVSVFKSKGYRISLVSSRSIKRIRRILSASYEIEKLLDELWCSNAVRVHLEVDLRRYWRNR